MCCGHVRLAVTLQGAGEHQWPQWCLVMCIQLIHVSWHAMKHTIQFIDKKYIIMVVTKQFVTHFTYRKWMLHIFITVVSHGPLVRYVKLRVAHALGMPGTLTPPPRFSDPDLHHGTCVTHVPWCMPGSLTNGFFWSRWWGKRSRHSRLMHNPRFCVSGKRAIDAMTSLITGHPTVGPTTSSV